MTDHLPLFWNLSDYYTGNKMSIKLSLGKPRGVGVLWS